MIVFLTTMGVIFVALVIALLIKGIFEGTAETFLGQLFVMVLVSIMGTAEVLWLIPAVVRYFLS
jgi:hypothetical protein